MRIIAFLVVRIFFLCTVANFKTKGKVNEFIYKFTKFNKKGENKTYSFKILFFGHDESKHLVF